MGICVLVCYLVWHLRKVWAPMTFTARPRNAPPMLPPRSHASTTNTATTTAASAACSTTSPPSPTTRSATQAPTPKSHPRRSHPRSAAPFNCSTPPSRSEPRSHNNYTTLGCVSGSPRDPDRGPPESRWRSISSSPRKPADVPSTPPPRGSGPRGRQIRDRHARRTTRRISGSPASRVTPIHHDYSFRTVTSTPILSGEENRQAP